MEKARKNALVRFNLASLSLTLLSVVSLAHADSRWFVDLEMGAANFTDKPGREHWDLNSIGSPGVGGLSIGKEMPLDGGHTWRAFLRFESQGADAEYSMLGLTEGSSLENRLFGAGVSYQHALSESWYLRGIGELGWYTSELDVYQRQGGATLSRTFESDGNHAAIGIGVGYQFNRNWHAELGVRRQYLIDNEFRDQFGDTVSYGRANQTLFGIGYTF